MSFLRWLSAPIRIANSSARTYDDLLTMLADGIASQRGRYGAYLYRDRVNKRLKARRGARMIAIMNGGAIPETALYTVVAEPEGTVVGTLHEDFAVESLKGDIVLLGNMSWRIRRVEAAGRILVEDAHGAPPIDSVLAGRSARTHRRTFAATRRAAAKDQRPDCPIPFPASSIRNRRKSECRGVAEERMRAG